MVTSQSEAAGYARAFVLLTPKKKAKYYLSQLKTKWSITLPHPAMDPMLYWNLELRIGQQRLQHLQRSVMPQSVEMRQILCAITLT